MAATAGAFSIGDKSNREDIWDQIKDLDPLETYVTSHAGEIDVTNIIHSWVIDPVTPPTTGSGTAELTATSYAATNPYTMLNTTQIIEQGWAVSNSNKNTNHAGIGDKIAREKMKAMKLWKQNLEISAVVGTMVTGTGTGARTMLGFVRQATLTTGYSGVSLTSDMLNSMLKTNYDTGGEHDVLLVTSTLKQRISGYVTPNTRVVAAEDAAQVGRVDVYDSDFGRIQVVLHRYIGNAAGNSYQTMASYISDYVSIGFMDRPHFEDRAITGYFQNGAVAGEATVQLANPLAANLQRGLL